MNLKHHVVTGLATTLSFIATPTASADNKAPQQAVKEAKKPKTNKNGLAPQSIEGMVMNYSDLHGDYEFTFTKDGKYKFTTVSKNGKLLEPEFIFGTYTYKRASPGVATITCRSNGSKDPYEYNLTFSSPHKAKGKVKGDMRTYAFSFKQPKAPK